MISDEGRDRPDITLIHCFPEKSVTDRQTENAAYYMYRSLSLIRQKNMIFRNFNFSLIISRCCEKGVMRYAKTVLLVLLTFLQIERSGKFENRALRAFQIFNNILVFDTVQILLKRKTAGILERKIRGGL